MIPRTKEKDAGTYRDKLATLDSEGKRKWVYAYKPSGKFYSIRTYLSWFYFVAFFTLPFVTINGRPLFLLDVTQARFILFGKVFWPQDFFILGLGMVTFIFFIILFTTAFGRLFCGWACPQTNFLEMMFRKIEFLVEGDGNRQKMLDRQPWNSEKITKKTVKHLAFFSISLIIANVFLAYVIGADELIKIIREPVSQHIAGFSSLLVFSGVFYGVFAFFRDQVCTQVCPYGRLQGVLLDKNSMIVAYDYQRGEPRGNTRKNASADCIDCFACVKVCPTGIDIRNGLQMECVNCTACIDACDNIMDKIGKPRGLIRFASENSIQQGTPLKFTGRMKAYTILCGVAVLILSAILFTRTDVSATVMRTPGLLFQERGADSISNLYNIKLSNKTLKSIPLTIKLAGNTGNIQIIGKPYIEVAKEGQGSGSFFVVLPKSFIKSRKTELELGLFEGEKKIDQLETVFLGPVAD